MFVENLKDDFYKVIQKNRCLLLVNFDIDAICACKILQQLFKNDNIVYTLAPVQGVDEMAKAYEDFCEEVKNVIMINCGGSIDVVELLEPPEDVTFYIVDSHRPFDLCNIYSEGQVRILNTPTEEEQIPDYADVFEDESSDDENEEDVVEDSEEEGESHQTKRRRTVEENLLKRRKKREWEEKRETILFNYTQYSYYSKSSALLLFEMAWKMSKDSLDMAWWAIIGVTEQLILNKIESQSIILEMGNLQGHVSRLSHRQGVDAEEQQLSAVKITYGKDLKLALYRHWTVEASLRHSLVTAATFRLWSFRGEKRLKEFLAEMGLPLQQSKQQFSAMDLNLRQEFYQMVEKLAAKYNIENILNPSFILQYGYRFKYCAYDVVYAMLALLESSSKDKLPQHRFLDSLDCLSRLKKDILELGIKNAKLMLTNIFKTSQVILEMKQVKHAGSFLYVIIPESTSDSRLFANPHALIMLAQFILKAYVEASRNKNAQGWPLLASAAYNNEEGVSILVGVPPIAEDQPRSLFGKAFEQAAKNTSMAVQPDYFDTTIVSSVDDFTATLPDSSASDFKVTSKSIEGENFQHHQ